MTAIFGHIHFDPESVMGRGEIDRAWIGERASASNGGVRIVADARLDDRVSLARSLGLSPGRASDAELILSVYQRYGSEAVGKLLGDFAFAIWDDSARELFCARDVFGVVPLYYRHDRDGVAFSTHLASIRREDNAPSHERIAAFLVGLDDTADDTAFTSIRRLPPGHSLLWRRGEIVVRRYASITPQATLLGEDHAAGIRQRFLDAVHDRSRGIPRLGAMLSGGLDSSSIVAAVAQRGEPPLRTFSFAYPKGSPYDESEFVAAMIERYPLLPDFVPMAGLAPLDGLAELASGMDDLIFGPGLLKVGRLLGRARQVGVRVVLDGHGGDEVISHGYGRLKHLARQRRWRTLYQELRGVSAVTQESAVGLLLQFISSEGVVAKLRKLAAPSMSQGAPPAPLLDRDLERATDIGNRAAHWARAYAQAASSEAGMHVWNVTAPSVASGFEALRRIADTADVTVRFPFYDRRLVSYALAVPDAEKLRGGWTRRVMREAMEGMLPDRVRWRRTKTDFSAELSEGMARHHAPFLTDILRNSGPLVGFVDLPAARHRLDLLLTNPRAVTSSEVLALWRMSFLALWLGNRTQTRALSRATS